MNNFITKIEDIPLNAEDLLIMYNKLTDRIGSAISYSYDELKDITNVHQLLEGKYKAAFILLDMKDRPSMGHWVVITLSKQPNDVEYRYSFYDPYAFGINELVSKTTYPEYLLRILKSSRIDINRHKHQRMSEHINTCGRHIVVRGVFSKLNNEEYHKKFITPIQNKYGIHPDELVALMTGLLNKQQYILSEYF